MRFSLVVPALNEEEAIADTLRRVLAARASVIQQTPATEMIAVFVNDGSTDRTQEIADQPEFDEVVKVRFEANRGYGAAIKAGWRAVDADLLGFIDADGTCDPEVCVDLVNRIAKTEADVVLAARLTPESKMPLIRKIGNKIFARLLGLVSGRELTDSASGFRIVRRSSLKFMTPLPDGLHFTPAMSAICLLDPRLRIEEVPFQYQERVGRSKLSVIKDGIRFLYVILFTTCCYNPIKTALAASLAGLLLVAAAAGLNSLAEGPAVQLLPITFTWAATSALIMSVGVVCHQLNYLLLGPRRKLSFIERTIQRTLHHYRLIAVGMSAMLAGLVGLVSMLFIDAPTLSQAFSWAAAFGLITLAGCGAIAGGIITRIIWAVGEKHRALVDSESRVEHGSTVQSTSRDDFHSHLSVSGASRK